MIQLGNVEVLVDAPGLPVVTASEPVPSSQVIVPIPGPRGVQGDPGVLLLDAGAEVPEETPINTIIFERA